MAGLSMSDIRIRSDGDQATVYWSDDSIAHVSGDVFSRSNVLRQALSDTSQDDVRLTLPKGVLEAWLASFDLLNIDWRAISIDRSQDRTHKLPWNSEEGFRLHEYIQAADFLDDPETLALLCQLACRQLYRFPAEDPRLRLDFETAKVAAIRQYIIMYSMSKGGYASLHKLVQEVSELPKHLQQAVLSYSHILLRVGAHFLPDNLQGAAVHAAHPSIASSSSLKVPYLDLHTDAYFNVVGGISSLQQLHVEARLSDASVGIPSMGKLANLRTLIYHLRDDDSPGALTLALATVLPSLSSLQHLNLSDSVIPKTAAADLAASIAKLTRLTHLDLRHSWPECEYSSVVYIGPTRKFGGLSYLACTLRQLTGLQFLDISQRRRRPEFWEGISDQLAGCSCLQELRMNGVDGAGSIIRAISGSLSLLHLEVQDLLWESDFTDHLHMLSTLKSLKIGYRIKMGRDLYLPPEGVTEMCIGKLSLLQDLRLLYGDCVRSIERMKDLTQHITNLCCLTALYISGKDILDDEESSTGSFDSDCTTECTALADLVCSCTRLQVLHLREETASVVPVAAAFMTRLLSLSTLHELVLHAPRCQLSDKHFSAPVKGAMNLRSLTLQFSQGSYYDERLNQIAFANLLQMVPALALLDIRGNKFDIPEAVLLADSIGNMTDLQTLSFSGCRFSDIVWDAIVAKLSKLVHLRELDVRLAEDHVHPGPFSFVGQLGALTSLCKLYVPDRWVTDQAEFLGKGLGKLKNLRELVVGSGRVGAGAATSLAPHMSHLTSLQRIQV